jgi:hypothetical protein
LIIDRWLDSFHVKIVGENEGSLIDDLPFRIAPTTLALRVFTEGNNYHVKS